MPNQLAAERSPYLLQHADNPVNWYPWGEEAFREAERRDVPIFLSIGYSTCHWCHVMAHESFESVAIAALLNEHFVPVKVDREERPDVDRVYMTFVQATTGAGGWPMSVWLTPDLKPFYGGTYFPPESRWGRPGFAEILQEISRVWSQERPKVQESANVLTERLRSIRARNPGNAVPTPDALAEGVAEFRRVFDSTRGGFGDAPKFPRPSELLFLLREAARTRDDTPKLMVGKTLYAMALGGMRDHIGGGFHRYSVDADWRVPHFEKMLYDQAQITLALLEMAQISGDAFFADVAEDTLEYVRREMTNAEGGFFSAEDADSLPPEQVGRPGAHKSEGAFYLWQQPELESLLGEDGEIFKLRFGILPNGNAPHDPQGEFTGKNILYVARSIEDIAAATGRSTADVMAALGCSRMVLFQARLQRPRPHLDDKVLAGWNGLMLAAFARASRVLAGPELGIPDTVRLKPDATERATELKPDATERATESAETYLNVAIRSAQFLRQTMWDADRKVLRRRFREGETAIDGYAEDYAFVIFGLLELFQTTGDHAWLEWALELQQRQDQLFDDPEGGWFNTTGQDPSVILRLKEDHDGAEPSASSVGVMNLLALAHLTGDPAMFRKIEATLRMFGPELGRGARAVPMMTAALSWYHAGARQIVIVGPGTDDRTRALWRVVGQRYDPFSIAIPVEPGQPQVRLGRILPSIESMQVKGGHATAYVCRDFVCTEPVTDPAALEAQLSEVP